jgi:hypothetical protein
LASTIDDLFVLPAPTSRDGLTRGLEATRPRVRRSPRASWSRDHALDPAGRPNLDRWAGRAADQHPSAASDQGLDPGWHVGLRPGHPVAPGRSCESWTETSHRRAGQRLRQGRRLPRVPAARQRHERTGPSGAVPGHPCSQGMGRDLARGRPGHGPTGRATAPPDPSTPTGRDAACRVGPSAPRLPASLPIVEHAGGGAEHCLAGHAHTSHGLPVRPGKHRAAPWARLGPGRDPPGGGRRGRRSPAWNPPVCCRSSRCSRW